MIDFDSEASGSGVMKRMAGEDFDEAIKGSIGADVNQKILSVETYNTPLYKHQMTDLILHHEFVAFQTKEFYWSIEKDMESLIFQRSKNKDNVKLKRGRKSLLEETSWQVTLKRPTSATKRPTMTVRNLITFLYIADEVNNTYFYPSQNCQAFAKRLYDYIKG